MSGTRPDVSELEAVTGDAFIFRFVQPSHVNLSAPEGARLQAAALQTNEYTPNARSYGASVYVELWFTHGLLDLYEACPKWRDWQVARIPVSSLLSLGVRVLLSPADCEFEAVRHAHASLLGVTREIRNKLIRVIEANLVP